MFQFLRFNFVICISVLVAGCAVGPDFEPPELPKTESYTQSELIKETASAPGQGGQPQRFIQGQDIPAEWWHLFKCQPLNELIKQGLKNSPHLEAAQAVLRQARENLTAEIGTAFLPAVDAQLGAQRNKANGATSGLSNSPPQTFNLYNASVQISYTFDLFGGARRQVEALESQVEYQNFQLEAAYLTLTANIVTAAINEASLRAQIKATQEVLSLPEQQLKIIKSQVEFGGASQADIYAQETLLAQTRASLPDLQHKLAQSRHALSVLVGSFPSASKLSEFTLEAIHLPLEIPVTIPSSLVRKRPDIRASEALLHEASAQVGIATANLYPQFTLTGNYGSQTNHSHDLLSGGTNIWGIGSQILQPIFRGGSLIAKENAAIANYDQAFAQYRQTVLQAFQNVADTLHALEVDAQMLNAQAEAEEAASKGLALTQKQFRLGAISYLTLLNAERQYQQTRINRIQAQAMRYADTAALFQALGGGWWNRTPLNDRKQAQKDNNRI
jgi:NodT family efflux transporter outer membrane factor (OMF) lipoprotein